MALISLLISAINLFATVLGLGVVLVMTLLAKQ
jgi:hypothetical protein